MPYEKPLMRRGYELHISEIHAGTIHEDSGEYVLPDIYLGILPTQEEAQRLYENNIREFTFTIEDPGGLYGSPCYLSLRIPARDLTQQLAPVDAWKRETLAYIPIPSQSLDMLIVALQGVQRMRRAQQT